MKLFFKDLWMLTKNDIGFIKKHPLGTALFCIIPGGIFFVGYLIWWNFEDLKSFINDKIYEAKKKKNKESV